MKKSILSLLMLVFAGMTTMLMAQEVRQGAVLEFEKDVHNYGDVEYQGNGTYSFVFSNKGTEPLVISNAKGSCGCTVPSWPKEPIAPGATAKIDVTYDTKRVGPISKSVTISSNAVNTPVKVIRIKGVVLAMETEVEEVVQVMDVPPAEIVEVPEVPAAPEMVVPLTKKQQKAAEKAEKKAAKAKAKLAKAKMKADKKKLKEEEKQLKAKAN